MITETQTGKLNGDLVRGLSIDALSIPESGWPLRPFQIVSLLDMNKFVPGKFVYLRDQLHETEKLLAHTIPASADISDEVDKFIRLLAELVNEVRKPLEMMANEDEVASRFSSLLVRINGHSRDEGGRSNVAVQHELRVFRETLERGIGQRLFLFVPKPEANYYDQQALFGKDVAETFPQANKEITQAGNCYSIQAYTAAIFHSMRAVEHGARAMVAELRIVSKLKKKAIELCDWGELIKALEDKVLDLGSKKSKSAKAMKTYEYYSQAVAQFRHFRGAWRNSVSHLRKTYQPGEAKDVMDNTRQFMQHLAIKLKE